VEREKLTTILKLSGKTSAEFLTSFAELWADMSDKAMDGAMMLLKTTPEETKRIDDFLRVSFRCAMLIALIEEVIKEEEDQTEDRLRMDPPQHVLDEMRAHYLTKMRAARGELH